MDDKGRVQVSRREWLLGVAGLAMGALAACRLGQPAAGSVRGVKRPVEVWTGFYEGRMGEAILKVIQHFNETVGASRGYEASHIVVPWGEIVGKVQTAVAGGAPPDAFRGWSYVIPTMATVGTLSALDEYAQRDSKQWNQADIWPSTLEQVIFQGKLYGAPISSQVDFLYANKGVLREVGLDVARPPRELEGWVQWGEKATQLGADGSIVRAGFLPPLVGDPLTWCTVFGGSFYDAQARRLTLNHPNNVRTYEWMKAFVDRYGAQPMEEFRQRYSANGWGRKSPDGAFYTGRFALWVYPVWLYNDIKEFGPQVDFDVRPVPSPAGVQAPPGITRVNCYLMPAGARQPDGGWEFLKYMSLDRYVMLNKVLPDSVPPSRRSLAMDKEGEAQAPWLKMARDEILPRAAPLPMVPNLQFVQGQMGAALAAVRLVQKSPKQALDDAQQAAQADLEQTLRR
jgi:multiple sugar transport system substrate-binding protein